MDKETYIKISKTHHWIPPLLFGPLAAIFTYGAIHYSNISITNAALYILAGIIFWTFQEYVLHRFQFHKIIKSEPLKYLVSEFHLIHHERPYDPRLVIAPLGLAIPVYALTIVALRFITGSWGIATLIGVGIIIGYLVYEWVHFFTHHRNPKTRVGKYLKQYHMVHHFKDSHNYYGVTSPFWDIVFGTKPELDYSKETDILPILTKQKPV